MTIMPGQDPVPSLPDRDRPPPGMTPDLRDGRRARPGRRRDRVVRGRSRRSSSLSGAFDALNVDLIMVDVWDWTFRQLKVAGLLGKVDCPCCAAAAVRVARRGTGLAHDDPLRPQRRAGRRPPRRAARLSPSWPRGSHRWATSGTTPSCSGSPPKARVHRLPRRPGDHQGDQRHRQGADALCPVCGKLKPGPP